VKIERMKISCEWICRDMSHNNEFSSIKMEGLRFEIGRETIGDFCGMKRAIVGCS
jgi:hypothetical protein